MIEQVRAPPPAYWVKRSGPWWNWGAAGGFHSGTVVSERDAVDACWAHRDAVVAGLQRDILGPEVLQLRLLEDRLQLGRTASNPRPLGRSPQRMCLRSRAAEPDSTPDYSDIWLVLTTGPGCRDGVFWRPGGNGYSGLIGAGVFDRETADRYASRRSEGDETVDEVVSLGDVLSGRHDPSTRGPTVYDVLLGTHVAEPAFGDSRGVTR